MTPDAIRKGQMVRHVDHGLAIVKRVLVRGVVTIELKEGIRAGQWYDANPARLAEVTP